MSRYCKGECNLGGADCNNNYKRRDGNISRKTRQTSDVKSFFFLLFSVNNNVGICLTFRRKERKGKWIFHFFHFFLFSFLLCQWSFI